MGMDDVAWNWFLVYSVQPRGPKAGTTDCDYYDMKYSVLSNAKVVVSLPISFRCMVISNNRALCCN